MIAIGSAVFDFKGALFGDLQLDAAHLAFVSSAREGHGDDAPSEFEVFRVHAESPLVAKSAGSEDAAFVADEEGCVEVMVGGAVKPQDVAANDVEALGRAHCRGVGHVGRLVAGSLGESSRVKTSGRVRKPRTSL